MATSIISAGDAANLGVQTTGGDDGVLVLRSGVADAKVDALTISSAGLLTIVDDLVIKTGGTIGGANDTDLLTLTSAVLTVAGEVVGTGFTGTLDGILGSGTAAAATTTTLASTTITASGIVKTDDTTAATSTTDGSLQTDGGLSVVLDAVIGGDIKVKNLGVITAAGTDFEAIELQNEVGDLLREDGGRVMSETSSSLSLGGGGLVGFDLDGPLTIGGGLTVPHGNVGIGTTAPSQKLEVAGSILATGGSVSIGTGGLYQAGSIYSDANWGMIFRAKQASAGVLANFRWANSADTELMRIAADGKVGIGTTAPYSQLDVYSAIASSTSGEASGVGTIRITNGATALTSAGGLEFKIAGDSNGYGAKIQALNSGGAQLVFANRGGSATWTERMRINSNGTIGIAVTAIGDVQLGMQINGQSWFAVFESDDGTDQLRIASSGNVTNTNNSYGAISDIKLKENITAATPKLADLMQVKICNFNFIGDTTKQIGVIAQELETVFPGMVDDSPDPGSENNDLGTTTKSVKYSVFVPILIKAMQEQQATIEALTARITALEG